MPENTPTPIDPSKVPQQSLQAMINLTEQVRKLSEVLGAQGGNPGSRAESVSQAAQSVKDVVIDPGGARRAQEALRETQERQPAGTVNPSASEPEYRFMSEIGPIEALKGGLKGRKDRKGFIKGAFQQERNKPRATQGPGEVNPSASRPEKDDNENAEGPDTYGKQASLPPNMRGPRSKTFPGMSEREVEEMQEDSIKIPQFGEWQLDTKLRMARDVFGKLGANRFDKHGDQDRVGKAFAGISQAAHYSQAHAAELQVLKNYRKRAFAYGENAMGMGAELGYSPQDGVLPSNVLGFRNPLAYLTSSAGRQGLGMNLDAYKMARLGTGMSLQQAHEVYGALAGMGFSNQHSGFLGMTTGGDLQNVASGLVAPMVRQGMNPGVASQFAESLKTGQVSIRQLHDAIKDLGGVAKETRQTVNQAAEGLQSYATTAVGLGASPTQAYRAGISFSTITGQNAQTAGNLIQNPLFQGMAMRKYGALPGNIGTLPGPQIAKTQKESIDLLEHIFKGVEPIRENGKIIVSQEKAREAYTAKELGITQSEVHMAKTKGPKLEAMARAQMMAEPESSWNQMYGGMLGRAKTPILNKRKQEAEERARIPSKHKNVRQALEKVKNEYENHEGEFSSDSVHVNLSQQEEEKLRHGTYWNGEWVAGTDAIKHQLAKAGASKGEQTEYAKANFSEKSKKASEILRKHGQAGIPGDGKSTTVNGVTIGMTKATERFFNVKQGSGEREANEGGSPLTNQAARPGIPEG